MVSVKEYREEKDETFILERYKKNHPDYFHFINNFQLPFYDKDSTQVTMGADYGFYNGLTNYILENKPEYIVEYGPGFTTVLLHRIAQDLDYDLKVVSYENDPIWFDRLNKMGCNPFGTMELVDLKIQKETDDLYFCYYDHSPTAHKNVDFVIIDGPGEVIFNGLHKRNINVNVDMMEKTLDREINHIIDGRHETQDYYKLNYKQR